MKILKNMWDKWLGIAKVIGNFQSQVLLSIFYLILFPLGVFIKYIIKPLQLQMPRNKNSNFTPWKHSNDNVEDAQNPF